MTDQAKAINAKPDLSMPLPDQELEAAAQIICAHRQHLVGWVGTPIERARKDVLNNKKAARAAVAKAREVIGTQDRAVSISRASQGSGVGTEGDVALLHKWLTDRGISWGAAVLESLAALSPPATPQAPEDVRDGSWEGRSYCAGGILLGGIEPAKGGEWRWFLSGWGGSKQLIHTEVEARASVEALVSKTLPSRAHLLATPVTVTEAECQEILEALGVDEVDGVSFKGFDLALEMRRVLGRHRIQIEGKS